MAPADESCGTPQYLRGFAVLSRQTVEDFKQQGVEVGITVLAEAENLIEFNS